MLHLHLKPIHARHYVYAISIHSRAVLALRLFTGALCLLRPTLHAGHFISRTVKPSSSSITTIDGYNQAVTLVQC